MANRKHTFPTPTFDADVGRLRCACGNLITGGGACCACYRKASSAAAHAAAEKKRTRRQREADVKCKYALSVAQYQALLMSQRYRCAACNTPFSESTRGDHVDHDHDTNEVRGLLCLRCNAALGFIEAQPWRLAGLLKYMKKHGIDKKPSKPDPGARRAA